MSRRRRRRSPVLRQKMPYPMFVNVYNIFKMYVYNMFKMFQHNIFKFDVHENCKMFMYNN